jgi:hypothetical protein
MPLTIVVIDDSEEYRLIVRGLLRSVHDVTTFVGTRRTARTGSPSCDASGPTW